MAIGGLFRLCFRRRLPAPGHCSVRDQRLQVGQCHVGEAGDDAVGLLEFGGGVAVGHGQHAAAGGLAGGEDVQLPPLAAAHARSIRSSRS